MANTDHDQLYTCTTCSWEVSDTRHLVPATWLCRTCAGPVRITVEDNRYQRFAVHRVSAEQLVAGDQILHLGFVTLAPVDVLKSKSDRSDARRWSLTLSGVPTRHVPRGQRFDRILPA